MTKHIFGYEDAREFIKEHGVFMRYGIKNTKVDSAFDKFNIEDYCEVGPVFIFMEFVDAGTNLKKWHYQGEAVGIKILATGEIFKLWSNSLGKNRLYRLYPCNRTTPKHSKLFEYGEKEPRRIASPTKKKIEAWVDYWHLYCTAERDFANSVKYRNKAFADKFKDKYEGATFWEEEDGWVSRFRLIIGSLDFRYAALDNGSFVRKVLVYDKNVPSTEELLK